MPVIDADCHVIESDRTWEYMDAADEPYHPVPLPRLENGPDRARWDIQGRPAIRSATVTRARASRQSLSGHEQTTAAARTLSDIEARLAHMDELGVDVQVLYPTIYLCLLYTSPSPRD